MTSATLTRRSDFVWRDILVLITLLLAGLRLTYHLEYVIDPMMFDETRYLATGLRLPLDGFPAPEWAPLYAGWYFLLSHIQADPLKLYDLNVTLLTILLPIALYLYLRSHGLSLLPSTLLAYFLLTARANVITEPRVYHFALIIAFVTLFAISRFRRPAARMAAAGIGAILLAFVRPEFTGAYLLLVLSAVLVAIFCSDPGQSRLQNFGVVGLLLLLMGIAIWLFGSPMAGDSRQLIAFGQHYALNWVDWHPGVPLNPWDDWQGIITQDFGSYESLSDLLVSRPDLVVRHSLYNLIVALPTELVRLFVPKQTVESFLLLAFAFLVVWRFRLLSVDAAKRIAPEQSHSLLFIGACLTISGIVIIAIYPRIHYLFFAFFVAVALLAMLEPTLRSISVSGAGLLIICAALIVLSPNVRIYAADSNLENRATIHFMRSLGIESEVKMFSAAGRFETFLGNNYHRISIFVKQEGFAEFMDRHQINLVVLEERLRASPRLREDPEWIAFLAAPEDFGFDQLPVPNSDWTILVRHHLVDK